jgi:RNA polymerase sigma-70 factor, ECF subfamily
MHSGEQIAEDDGSAWESSAVDPHTLFELEVLPLRDNLYRLARRLTRDSADAEDLVQDTMVKAYRSMASYQANTHVMAWLVRIMQHRFIDNHRRRQRRPAEYLTGEISELQRYAFDPGAVSTGDTVESCFAVSTLTTAVRAAVQQLPEELRFAVYYAYVEGRQYKDIARLQCVPVGTVMSRLYRARRQLRDLLGESMTTTHGAKPAEPATRCRVDLHAERPESRANNRSQRPVTRVTRRD